MDHEELLTLLVLRCKSLLASVRPSDCILDTTVDSFYLDLVRETLAMIDVPPAPMTMENELMMFDAQDRARELASVPKSLQGMHNPNTCTCPICRAIRTDS